MENENSNHINPEVEKVEAERVETPLSETDNKMLMSVLCYIGPLVIIPYLTSREDGDVFFHIKQGVVLLIGWIILSVVSTFFSWIPLFNVLTAPIFGLVGFALFVISIIGIINAYHSEKKYLPLIGKYADKLKI